MLRVFAADEPFERPDGLLRVGHRVELVPDAVSRGVECVVVQEHVNCFAS